jgi:hypothetical protein
VSDEKLFYIQNVSAGYIGNNPVFWAIGGRGYTSYIDRAEKFSEADARAMVDHDSRKWRMWSVEEVEPHIYRTVECQTLEAERYKKKPPVIEAQERMLNAAPDLLEALQLIQGMNWNLANYSSDREIKRRALEAIAKATN